MGVGGGNVTVDENLGKLPQARLNGTKVAKLGPRVRIP